MADVFISYARAERSRVEAIANALMAEGFTIWFDSHLQPGETFRDEIERELNAAKVVLVVWSAQSVQSQWVRAEAGRGMERGVLVPVCIDRSMPPLPFSELQTPDLSGWMENRRDPVWRSVVEKIKTILTKGPHEPVFVHGRDKKFKPHPKDKRGKIYLGQEKMRLMEILPSNQDVDIYYLKYKEKYMGYVNDRVHSISVLFLIISAFAIAVLIFLFSYNPWWSLVPGLLAVTWSSMLVYYCYIGVELNDELGERLLVARYISDAEIDVKRLVE